MLGLSGTVMNKTDQASGADTGEAYLGLQGRSVLAMRREIWCPFWSRLWLDWLFAVTKESLEPTEWCHLDSTAKGTLPDRAREEGCVPLPPHYRSGLSSPGLYPTPLPTSPSQAAPSGLQTPF